MSLIRAENMSAGYGELPALKDVSLEINKGEIVTVVGPNGSGKSTLMKALMGVIPVSTGHVERAPGLTFGYVPQSLHINPTLPLTVERFLALPQRRAKEDVLRVLERVGAADTLSRQMTALSGGQFQRVLLARALLAEPDILILDEAAQGLDQPGIAAFYHLVESVRSDTGTAVLMVSHDLNVVMRASDRVICLNGHICCQGTPASVAAAPEYHALFGHGEGGAFAIYSHHHDHSHDHSHDHEGHAH